MLAVAALFPDAGPLASIATAIGVVSVAIVGLAELGTKLKLDFRRIAPIVTFAFLGFLAWTGMVSVLIFAQGGGLPVALGWLGIVSILVGIVIVAWIGRQPGVIGGEREPDRRQMIAFVAPMIGIVCWLGLLGLNL